MARERIGLYELISLAEERWLSRVVVLRTDEEIDHRQPAAPLVQSVISEVVPSILDRTAFGCFLSAAQFADEYVQWIREVLDADGFWLEAMDEIPLSVLSEVCELAERIDCLLFSLERDNRALAIGCRDDLDGLLVLADWCEESRLPAAAAEARHLHSLVRHYCALLDGGPLPLVLWIREWEFSGPG